MEIKDRILIVEDDPSISNLLTAILKANSYTSTGISDATRLNHKEQILNNKVFDLQGRQIENSKLSNTQLRQGLYIKNGRKVLVK